MTPCKCTFGLRNGKDTHIVIATSDTMPGYLRLEHLSGACEFQMTFGIKKDTRYLHESRTYISLMSKKRSNREELVPSFKKDFGWRTQNYDFEIESTGPAETLYILPLNKSSGQAVHNIDVTTALKCGIWPSVADEWLTRERPSHWLSSTMVQQIATKGCHLVQVPHSQSQCPDIEWRFSFTYAENKLAQSLSETQRRCYVILKQIIRITLAPNTVISSYCLKNILFWKLDQIPENIWDNYWTGLGTCFLALIDELIHCLVNHNIPHYFIRENNLIGHKPRQMVQTALVKIISIRQNLFNEICELDNISKGGFLSQQLSLSRFFF